MNRPEMREGRVTALEPQKRDPTRVSLFLDGRFVCGLSEETALLHGLRVDKDLTPDDLDALLGDEETRRAREAAYLLLSYRARSISEIKSRLIQKGFAPPLVEQVTDDLAASGLLDDAAFAEGWVRNRQQSKPRGKSLLRRELRQKGVSPETAAAALEPIQPEDEVETARMLAQRRWERDSDPDPQSKRRRIIGLLQRRGYHWDTIREALAPLDDVEDQF